MAKLKLKPSSLLQNIYTPLEAVKEEESKNGNKYYVVQVFDYPVMVQEKWVNITQKKDKYSIGIKGNFRYPIVGTDSEVLGNDLIRYYFDTLKENKEKEELKDKVKGVKIEGDLLPEEVEDKSKKVKKTKKKK